VDDAEREPELCYRENARGPEVLAESCATHEAALLSFSSDLVFDGAKRSPYIESDEPSPLNVYGRSKVMAERRVLDALPAALVIRTSAFFGPWDEYNFVTAALYSLSAERTFAAADDVTISPTYVPDLVNASLDLLIDGEHGVWHLANPGELTWAELARWVATLAGLDASLVDARPLETLSPLAPRPGYGVLGSERGTLLPPLEHALSRYLRECEILFRETRRYSQHRR
jgi:dTDP-4-dehydrorhamnose reductase